MYEKTNWQENNTSLGPTNLNKIEQAIYDMFANLLRLPPYAVATNTGNDYVVSTDPNPPEYVDGMGIVVKINADSTDVATINWNNLGAKAVYDTYGNAVTNLKANTIYSFRYEAVSGNFILQGKGGGGNAVAAHVLTGETFTNDDGPQVGTMPNKGQHIIIPASWGKTIPEGYHDGTGYVSGVDVPANKVLSDTTIAGITGTIPIRSVTQITPTTEIQPIPTGWYPTDCVVFGDANLIPANIKSGVTIFGVLGTY